jgi:hypothetical protein
MSAASSSCSWATYLETITQAPVQLGINECDRKSARGKHTKFSQPEENIKTNCDSTGGVKRSLTCVLRALASTTADAVVHVVVANLVEQRVYKVGASDYAEPQVIPHHRVIQSDKTLTFGEGSN